MGIEIGFEDTEMGELALGRNVLGRQQRSQV